MKYLIIFTLTFLVSCSNTVPGKEDSTEVSIIRDVTDTHLLKPDANFILHLFNLSKNKSIGISFRYREISDKMLVPIVELQLPDESVTKKTKSKNEPLFREKIILNFYDTIRKLLNPVGENKDSSFRDYSECYKTICSELNVLSQSKSKNKSLLVYSNLFEHSQILNIYDKKTNILLIKSPDKITEQFGKTNLLPKNLKGIKVYFLFQPATREEDKKYMAIVTVYKRLLELRGCTVKIQANNNYVTD